LVEEVARFADTAESRPLQAAVDAGEYQPMMWPKPFSANKRIHRPMRFLVFRHDKTTSPFPVPPFSKVLESQIANSREVLNLSLPAKRAANSGPNSKVKAQPASAELKAAEEVRTLPAGLTQKIDKFGRDLLVKHVVLSLGYLLRKWNKDNDSTPVTLEDMSNIVREFAQPIGHDLSNSDQTKYALSRQEFTQHPELNDHWTSVINVFQGHDRLKMNDIIKKMQDCDSQPEMITEGNVTRLLRALHKKQTMWELPSDPIDDGDVVAVANENTVLASKIVAMETEDEIL